MTTYSRPAELGGDVGGDEAELGGDEVSSIPTEIATLDGGPGSRRGNSGALLRLMQMQNPPSTTTTTLSDAHRLAVLMSDNDSAELARSHERTRRMLAEHDAQMEARYAAARALAVDQDAARAAAQARARQRLYMALGL